MNYLKMTLSLLVIGCIGFTADGADETAAVAERDEAMAKLGQFVGGSWANDNPKFLVEFNYQWIMNKTAIRGSGVIDKGGPRETEVEATFGWDPGKKSVYYLDIHGGEQVLFGPVEWRNDELHIEFQGLVGPPARWRSDAKFADTDTYEFTIFAEMEGNWSPIVKQTLKRKPAEVRQVTEATVDAPLTAVWAAMTTAEGLEAWNVAHAEIDLKVGGKMLTHYDPHGRIGDPKTIENTIICFEPVRMFAIKATGLPAGFPFAKAIEDVWTVIYFDPAGSKRTRVRLVGLGYGDDEESKKLRTFFDQGNAVTLEKLQKHFAAKENAEKAD